MWSSKDYTHLLKIVVNPRTTAKPVKHLTQAKQILATKLCCPMIYEHISAQILQLPAISQCFIYVEKGINTNYGIALALCCNTNVANHKKARCGLH
jgi:hypothetical protein